MVGDILFSRQKLCCRDCGNEQYPLDEALGIPSRRLVTLGLKEKALWLATEMDYDRASLGMSKLCDISISDETIKNLVIEEGAEVLKQKEGECRKVWEEGKEITAGKGKDRVFFQVDGTGINDRATKGWFEAYVLDFWHLARNIKVCLGAERKELIGELLGLAGKGATAAKIDFYGSGPVEKAVDVTICRRFKKRGMSWYVHKANPLLALKLLKLNGQWRSYWRQKGLVTV